MKAPSVRPVRCAIYTRVSTEHGLDQEFNSLQSACPQFAHLCKDRIEIAFSAGINERSRTGFTEWPHENQTLTKFRG